jgi:hypothetical protein
MKNSFPLRKRILRIKLYVSLLGFKEIHDVIVMHDLLAEIVSSSFWRPHHFNYPGKIFSLSGLQRCYYFLCRDLFF